jgi:hypothetical protein
MSSNVKVDLPSVVSESVTAGGLTPAATDVHATGIDPNLLRDVRTLVVDASPTPAI